MDVSRVAQDLGDEQQALDVIVAELDADGWTTPTPSAPWTVADQIGHLTYYDDAAAVAITDPEAFHLMVEELWTAAADLDTLDDLTLGRYRALHPDQLIGIWRQTRRTLADAALTLSNDSRVDWYGPSMGSMSFLTARLMEVWAHGQDVVDATGAERAPTARLRHIAKLGFITRGWSYANRGLETPPEPVRVDLEAPSGESWSFGPDDADESISGPAEDFCLVVTQRRHLDDTTLDATPIGRDWLLEAQCFAGPPTDGPRPGARP